MVPPNWKHPRNDRGYLQPMHDRSFTDVFSEWLSDFDRMRVGDLDDNERELYVGEGKNPLAEWLLDAGVPPNPAYYRPWRDDEATWVQVWETVSEGTPVSPPFATRAALVEHLVAHSDEVDEKYGHASERGITLGGYSREQVEALVNVGSVPSIRMVEGKLYAGIEAAARPPVGCELADDQ